MKMIKQAPGSEECGACVVAMVTNRTREEVLKDRPNPAQRDCDWLNYMEELGFVLDDPRDDPGFDKSKPWPEMYNGYLNLPKGSRYYCTIAATLTKIHALAIDEERMVLDPSTSASMEGTWILGDFLRWHQQHEFPKIAIVCCRRVRRPARVIESAGSHDR